MIDLGVAHRVFNPSEVGIFFHGVQQLVTDRHAGRKRNVIEIDGNFYLLEKHRKISRQSVQARVLVIKRRHDEQPIRANGFRMLREFPRLGKIRGARRNDNVQAVAVLEGGFRNFLSFGHRKGGEFAGRSEDDYPIGAVGFQVGKQVLVQFFIEFQIFVTRRRGRDPEQNFFARCGRNACRARLGEQRFRNSCAAGNSQRGTRSDGTQKSSSRGLHDSLPGRKPAKV